VRKKIYLYSAIFWSGLILYLCLENAQNLKEITIPNFDKFIHIVFHFVFTILWFLYLKKKFKTSNNINLLAVTLIVSFVFGIAIELMQQYFTTTRAADVFDILANLLGAFLAASLLILVNAYNGIIDKI
jgi:VanZ family protein